MRDEVMVRNIENAIHAHALWKARLVRAVEGKGDPINRSTASDCHACAFGKWLDGERSSLAVHAEYEAIYAMHKEFHHDVGVILGQIQGGSHGSARQALSGDGELRLRSSRLISLLMKWKAKAA